MYPAENVMETIYW